MSIRLLPPEAGTALEGEEEDGASHDQSSVLRVVGGVPVPLDPVNKGGRLLSMLPAADDVPLAAIDVELAGARGAAPSAK